MRIERAGMRALLWLPALLAVACAAMPTEEAKVAGVDSLPPPEVAAVQAPTEPISAASLDPGLEARIFVLANKTRERAGAPVLDLRLDLIEVARAHALDMANRAYFSHKSPEGSGPGERAAHIDFHALGENLARIRYADEPGPLAIQGWLDSPAHRKVLLDERGVNYRYTGIGAARAPDGTVYVAQLFLK